ncbi:MAG: barstar family protein [Clostridia bacterium]|nr:barstar family protein [Clostridia bacterium]
MKIVLLDGERIKNNKEMHACFKKALDLPEWYGGNLDALHDVLSESSAPLGVIIANADKLAETLGWRWEMLLRLLVDVKRERKNFYVTLDPFGIEDYQ